MSNVFGNLTQKSISDGARFTRISNWIAILQDRAKRVLMWHYEADGAMDFKPSSQLAAKVEATNAMMSSTAITGSFSDLTFFSPVKAGPTPYVWKARALDPEGVERSYFVRSDKAQLAAVEDTAGPVRIIVLTGESTSRGGGDDSTMNLTTAIDTHRCLMMSGGGGGTMEIPALTAFDPGSVDDFEPVKESGAAGKGESPLTACANWRDAEILDNNRSRKTFVVRTHGKAGAAIAQIAQGTGPYIKGIAEVTRIVEMMELLYKKSCIVEAVFCITGVNDRAAGTTRTEMKDALIALQDDYNTDLKAITGQTTDIPLVISQVRAPASGAYSADMALGQLDAVETDDTKIQMFMTEYELQDAYGLSDSVHDLGPGYDVRGVYMGKWLYDTQDAAVPVTWKGMRVRDIAVVDSTHVDVRFWVPVEPIVIDTTRLPDFGNAGFRYISNEGGVTVTNAAVQTDDTIRLTFSGDVSAHTGRFIGYADAESGASNQSDRAKVWGNVFDSDDRTANIVTGLETLTVPNPAAIFRKAF